MVKTKHIIIGAGITLFAFVGNYFLKLKRLSDKLEITTRVKVNKVGISKGVELRVDVIMKNPTEGEMTIKYPFVVMESQGTSLASSDAKDLDYKIPRYGQVQLDPILITVPFSVMGIKLSDVYTQFKETGKITWIKRKVTVRTETTINGKIPYTKVEDFTI